MSVKMISPADVLRIQTEAGTHLIDVRTPGEYAVAHVEGAQLMPLDRLDPQAVMARFGSAADCKVCFICEAGGRAAKACAAFAAAGFDNVWCVEGGTAGWIRAGLPVIRGSSRVISLERQVRIGAGALIVIGALGGWLIHPVIFILCGLVGLGLIFAGITGYCGMGMMLARMPWNKGAPAAACGVKPAAAPAGAGAGRAVS